MSVQMPSMVPVMEISRFAEQVGLTVDAVRGQIKNGHLPSIKIGRYRMINLLALSNQCATSENSIMGEDE